MELISIINSLADKQCEKTCEYVWDDLKKDIAYLVRESRKCEEQGKPMTCLLMLRDLGTMCADLTICLEDDTWPKATFTGPNYRAPRAKTYIIELDAEKHPDRSKSGPCAYGTIREIPFDTCKKITSDHVFRYMTQIVRYKSLYDNGIVVTEMGLDEEALEPLYGKIESIEPEMTIGIKKKIEDARRLLRAAAKPIRLTPAMV